MQQMIWKDTTTNTWVVNMDYNKCNEYFAEFVECKKKSQAIYNFKQAKEDYHFYLDHYDQFLQEHINEWDNDFSVRNTEYPDYSTPQQNKYLITTKEQWVSHVTLLSELEKADLWAKLIAAQSVYQNFK